MSRRKGRYWMGLLLAGVMTPACSSPDLGQQAGVYRLAAAARSQPQSQEPAESARETEQRPDPELAAFEQQLIESCHIPLEGGLAGSTAQMIEAGRQLRKCADRRSRATLSRLPRTQRSNLLSLPAPADRDPDSWYPTWSSFVATACYLQDAELYSGTMRATGTIRGVTWAGCFADASEGALYWLELLAKNDATHFAQHLRRMAPAWRRAERRQDAMSARAGQLAETSYESGRPDDRCRLCALGDADFRKLVRAHGALQQGSLDLAEVTCSSWPELAAELGGVETCRELARLSWRALAQGDSGAEAWGEPNASDGERHRPATKDPDYARFIEPIYAGCEHRVTRGEEDILPCLDAALSRELAPLRSSRANEVLGFERDFGTFARLVCSVAAGRSLIREWGSERSFNEGDCHVVTTAHAVFLAHSWATDDDSTFRRHLSALARRAIYVGGDASLRLPAPAGRIANGVCRGWPALQAATRTEAETCEQRLTTYFIAYAELGAVLEPTKN